MLRLAALNCFRNEPNRRRNKWEPLKSLATNEGAELVRRCAQATGAAWEEIVQTFTRRIYNLAYRFTSRADAAEDLTQEVLLSMYCSRINTSG